LDWKLGTGEFLSEIYNERYRPRKYINYVYGFYFHTCLWEELLPALQSQFILSYTGHHFGSTLLLNTDKENGALLF
jgi:hypothetical protein